MSLSPSALFAALNASTAASGGSPAGISADLKASACGMSAHFSELVPRNPTLFPQQFFDPRGKPKPVGNRAGSAFHALQELYHLGRVTLTDLATPAAYTEFDASVGAAVMAFGRYVAQNNGDPNFLGRTVGVEIPIAGTIAGQSRTGRLDTAVEAEQLHIDRWAEYGIFAASPGLYLWDYKLLNAVTAEGAMKYQRTMQPLAYMKLYEQQTGVRPEGFVFELVSRAANPGISRMLVLAPNGTDNDKVITHFVKTAAALKVLGNAMPGACDNTFGSCAFLALCPRYGNVAEHADVFERLNTANLREMEEE